MMRLDKWLTGRYFSSRTKAARAIAAGLVKVNGRTARASDNADETDLIEIEERETEFVSEGGYKLEKALLDFGEEVKGCVFADLGASTGGFTECLLRHGAARVYAVDVGESQLDQILSGDARVVVMDKTNARYLTKSDFPEKLDGISIDVSFISLTNILPAAASLLEEGGRVFALIKPQFECGAGALDKHGIVKDAERRKDAIRKIVVSAADCGLYPVKITSAPVRERKNTEYIICLKKGGKAVNGGLEKEISNLP